MIGYIYKTTNKVNNKIYVGQKKSDKFLGESYLGSGKILTQAVAKYGKHMFKVELLDTADSLEELGEKERYWIKELRSQDPTIGYNIAQGGIHVPIEGEQNGFFGKHHTEETKQKMREAQKKHSPMSQETRNKIANANRGSHRTEETKKKMGDRQKGRKAYTDGVNVRYFFPDKEQVPAGFYPGTPKRIKEKQRDSNKNKQHNLSDDGRRRITESNYSRWKNYTTEEREQVSQNMRDADRKPNTYWIGRKRGALSDEHKQKISERLKQNRWITNGSISKMVPEEEIATYELQGFWRGRK